MALEESLTIYKKYKGTDEKHERSLKRYATDDFLQEAQYVLEQMEQKIK